MDREQLQQGERLTQEIDGLQNKIKKLDRVKPDMVTFRGEDSNEFIVTDEEEIKHLYDLHRVVLCQQLDVLQKMFEAL